MDQQIRNKLQNATQDARQLLEAEFAEQLEGTYDILPDGTIHDRPGAHLDDRQRLTRQKLLDAIKHRIAGGKTSAKAVADYTREAAFTFLNRFVALKMLEARELVQQCVSKGEQSSGFKEFTGLAPGLAELPDKGYRLYLECLFDELSIEVKILFDRQDVASLLWPRRQALDGLLATLNHTELNSVWDQDETIGWVYQYFNSSEERKKMREESAAPRNSHELAVRNQFFTPLYVVQFLTDNTLGRIWYEMRKGKTRLVDECRYLVRQPSEVFLDEGQEPPTDVSEADKDLSQEELLKKTVYVPHRPKKDPRDLKILDPACGSGHFLLYCFDLLLTIYEEAWYDEQSPESKITGKALREDYPTIEALREAVPRLILRHNLHGIEIDPRCGQIAAFALWMQAQSFYSDLGAVRIERPPIRKTNIVIAEPMPGEPELLKEFTATLNPPLLGKLVEVTFEKMKLAGEAGSLLKIEEEIRDSITTAREQWGKDPEHLQMNLFGPQPARQEKLDFSGITDDDFWQQAEERIYEALHGYVTRISNGQTFSRRLFAEDAERGFAFIDLCRNRYDVVVMNPPFGAFPISADKILNDSFPACRGDFYPAFIERWNVRSGFLGAITNRTGLSLKGLQEWRQSNLLGDRSLVLLADLGMNVLDALVEAAIYVIGPSSCEPLIAIDCLDMPAEKMAARIVEGVEGVLTADSTDFVFVRYKASFAKLPTAPISYKAPGSIIRTFARFDVSERNGLKFRVTSPNYDDFRYLRLKWEVSSVEIGRASRWSPIAKGGEYAPYYGDLDLLIDWDDKAESFRGFLGTVHRPLTRPACADLFFTGGLTWSERTASRFSPRILQEGSIFSSVGPYCGGIDRDEMLFVLGIIMSAPYQGILELFLAAGDATSSGSAARHYQVGALRSLPFPDFSETEKKLVREGVRSVLEKLQGRATREESNSLFTFCGFVHPGASIIDAANKVASDRRNEIEHALRITRELDEWVAKRFGIDTGGLSYLATIFGRHPADYPQCAELPPLVRENIERPVDEIIRGAVESGRTGRFITVKSYYADRKVEVLAHYSERSALSILPYYEAKCLRSEAYLESGESLASYVLGGAFGRWDIRFATGEKPAPELPDPFAPLPVCPPGQLQNEQGLPLNREEVERLNEEGHWNYPIQIPWDGILVDDPGHPLDIEDRVRQILRAIWKDRWEAIEREACELLGMRTLRDYFRKPAGFFADHLKRYSKSRRKAPIYWQLATSSASYSVWLYYHRFTQDTFYKVLNDYVKPKLDHEQRKLDRLRVEAGPEPTRSQRGEIDQQETFVAELKTFAEEIRRIAPLWNPDLNDGVIINFAPLWRLVPQHRPWQKECKTCWDKLVNGDYDWAYLAMYLWPERVVPKCRIDTSLAIAHGLENVFWKQDKKGKWVTKDEPDGGWESVIERLVTERSSQAVKAALESLRSAPTPINGKKTQRTRKRRTKSR